jgi:recombination protein RecA
VYGGASTAKSILGATILGYALRSGKRACLADTEHTFDSNFAKIYGLDSNHKDFYFGFSWDKDRPEGKSDQPATLEEFFDDWLVSILKMKSAQSTVAVVDTITALPAKIENEKDMDKQGFGAYRAKQISLGLRKYLSALALKNTTLVCIDQTRDNLDAFVKSEYPTGGRGLEFYSSVRLYLKHDKVITNSANKEIGIWVKFKVTKNKVAIPFRSGKFRLIFTHGLDDVATNLSFLAELQHGVEDSYKLTTPVNLPVIPTGDEVDGKTGGYTSKRILDWISCVEKNNAEDWLRQIVVREWAKAYETEERKPRVW